jgi:hypothetical protein
MAQITGTSVYMPKDMREKLKNKAKRNRRSLDEEIIHQAARGMAIAKGENREVEA